jgi:hypothetical protein
MAKTQKKIRRFVRFSEPVRALLGDDLMRKVGQDGVLKILDTLKNVPNMDLYGIAKVTESVAPK